MNKGIDMDICKNRFFKKCVAIIQLFVATDFIFKRV